MSESVKNSISSTLFNMPGWRTNRKIVVIESDDWGSIRMPSKEVFDRLLKRGYEVDRCPFNTNDSLEGNDDLEMLFEALTSVKDGSGNHPVMTLNNIVANPDFGKIKASDYSEYFYEPFTETLKKYPRHERVYALYKEGIGKNIIVPQFHGREHVNAFTWMRDLKANVGMARDIFDYGMFTAHKEPNTLCRREYLDSFGAHSEEELLKVEQSIAEGLDLFEKLWGMKSGFFIATRYDWHPHTESNTFLRYILGTVQRPLSNV